MNCQGKLSLGDAIVNVSPSPLRVRHQPLSRSQRRPLIGVKGKEQQSTPLPLHVPKSGIPPISNPMIGTPQLIFQYRPANDFPVQMGSAADPISYIRLRGRRHHLIAPSEIIGKPCNSVLPRAAPPKVHSIRERGSFFPAREANTFITWAYPLRGSEVGFVLQSQDKGIFGNTKHASTDRFRHWLKQVCIHAIRDDRHGPPPKQVTFLNSCGKPSTGRD